MYICTYVFRPTAYSWWQWWYTCDETIFYLPWQARHHCPSWERVHYSYKCKTQFCGHNHSGSHTLYTHDLSNCKTRHAILIVHQMYSCALHCVCIHAIDTSHAMQPLHGHTSLLWRTLSPIMRNWTVSLCEMCTFSFSAWSSENVASEWRTNKVTCSHWSWRIVTLLAMTMAELSIFVVDATGEPWPI